MRHDDAAAVSDRLSARMTRALDNEDTAVMKGHLRVEVRGPDGELKGVREVDNLIVTSGRDAIIERLDSTPTTVQPTHMAVGTGAVAPVAGNTTLGAELDRNALTSSTAAGGVLTMVANWAAGDATNAAITEAGTFNAGTGGTMYTRATFAPIPKGANDTLQLTWTLTLIPQ
jgi:hypothetical protein